MTRNHFTGSGDPGGASRRLASRVPALGMVGRVETSGEDGGLRLSTTLDPAEQPFLRDHQIGGTPVLPGVMGVEAFAEVASLLCPGLEVAAVERVEFLLPFKFFRMQPATLHLTTAACGAVDREVLVDVGLWSVVAPRAEGPPRRRLHFRGRVRMAPGPVARPAVTAGEPEATGAVVGREAIYRRYFHGPAYQVLDEVRVHGPCAVGLMARRLPPDTHPDGVASLAAPRLVELCFQTAGILQVARDGSLGLPIGFGVLRTWRHPERAEGERLRAVVVRREDGEGPVYDAWVMDDRRRVHVELEAYRTVSLPGRVGLDDLAAGGGPGTSA